MNPSSLFFKPLNPEVSAPRWIAGLALAVAMQAHAVPAIPNPSFEANNFTMAPGYVANNAPITGWTVNDANRVGLNPILGVDHFADNGKVPQGTKVAFIKSDGGEVTLSTTITGLTVGTHYRVQFRANRSTQGVAPGATYRVNGEAPVSIPVTLAVDHAGVHARDYALVNSTFLATATAASLEIKNLSNTESTLLVDQFVITAASAIQVTNASNDGPGSLRQAVASAAMTPGYEVITFAAGLSGQTISLLTPIETNDSMGVCIDGTGLEKGVTISGASGAVRAFTLQAFGHLTLRNLTLANTSSSIGEGGGAILSVFGVVKLIRCTITEHKQTAVGSAGALYNVGGHMSLTQCTLAENKGSRGGAIHNAVDGYLYLNHCTIARNTGIGSGGGIYNQGTVIMKNSGMGYNLSPEGADITNTGAAASVKREGANILQTQVNLDGAATFGPAAINAEVRLGILSDNGGPTKTMHPARLSPARNAAVDSNVATDQRGRPVQVVADIGACEVQKGKFVISRPSLEDEGSTETFEIERIDGFEGSASVKITTVAGTAQNGEFTPLNTTVNFADDVTMMLVTVGGLTDQLVESNEYFSLELSSPSPGTSLGTPSTSSLTIVDASSKTTAGDPVPPAAPVITSPSVNSTILGRTLELSGTATDNKGVKRVQIRIISEDVAPVMINVEPTTPSARSTAWKLSYTSPRLVGSYRVEATAYDLAGNFSTTTVRTWKVHQLLPVEIVGNGSVTPGFAPSSYREVDKIYTISPTPATGWMFKNWTVGGSANPDIGVIPVMIDTPTLTFRYRLGLTIKATFVKRPFASTFASTNIGLITPSAMYPAPGGTLSSVSTEGLMTVTTEASGAFSATMLLDGETFRFSGAFDDLGKARFGPDRWKSHQISRANKPHLEVVMGVESSPPFPAAYLIGTVSAVNPTGETVAVSNFVPRPPRYNGTTLPMPPEYLETNGANGVYSVIIQALPLEDQPPTFDESSFPQGAGFGTMTVTKSGRVTLTNVTLPDGTKGITASSFVQAGNYFPIFVQLYSNKGLFRANLGFDYLKQSTDLESIADNGSLWSRPAKNSHHYPNGWAVLKTGVVGARYRVLNGQSVLKAANGVNIEEPDADGNATLYFEQGKLTNPIQKKVNISTSDRVTKVQANDGTFTLSINRSTGIISGNFRHTDSNTIPYQGMVFQKGPLAGAYGFFLTKEPRPIDYTGESGLVRLIGVEAE